MRALVRKTITKEEAKILMEKDNINFEHPIIKKIIKKCSKYTKRNSASAPSYLRIDSGKHGHTWHKDTGTSNHMPWCNYGLSTLLSYPEDDGLFKYKSPELSYTQAEHYLNTIVHSSDEYHMVEPSKNRTVLLMFLA